MTTLTLGHNRKVDRPLFSESHVWGALSANARAAGAQGARMSQEFVRYSTRLGPR